MSRCECSDPGCKCCGGQCRESWKVTLYRVDMDDASGVDLCEGCAADALESGVFTTGDDADGEDEENEYLVPGPGLV